MAAFMVHYSGCVQGVGFRATTCHIAQRFAVTGCVKNLRDGRVQLIVEGEPADVQSFLQAVRNYWGEYVDDEQIESIAPTGSYPTFAIER